MSGRNHLLLTDEQMRKFITEGFLILNTDFSDEFHRKLTENLDEVYEKEGNPGNNLLPRIPELRKVFDHPVVTGALTSVLGPNYMMHAHRHGHYNAAPKEGGWHKDSYWGYYKTRNHHPWWAMIMYFPQDTPLEMGPTAVMPGTHHYETNIFASDSSKKSAVASGKAGTFALIHYDMWHQATPNILGKARYMLKFEFIRMNLLNKPSWDNSDSSWINPVSLNPAVIEQNILWEDTWHWMRGEVGHLANTVSGSRDQIKELVLKLRSEYEPDSLNAAYNLSTMGKEGITVLLQELHQDNVRISLHAAYGLSVSGKNAVEGLIAALDNKQDHIAVHAVFALGELGDLAAEAVHALIKLKSNTHKSVSIRRTVTESLGMIGTRSCEATDSIISCSIDCLDDEDAQIRFTAVLSLARIGAAAASAVPRLKLALDDENRYVRANAAEALNYIGTEEAKEVLIKFLFNARWCPTTTKTSLFFP